MNKIFNALKEALKNKQFIGIILIMLSIVSFIIISLIHHIWISLMFLIMFIIGVYLLHKYSTAKW